jgi:hypothetical protein
MTRCVTKRKRDGNGLTAYNAIMSALGRPALCNCSVGAMHCSHPTQIDPTSVFPQIAWCEHNTGAVQLYKKTTGRSVGDRGAGEWSDSETR